MKFRFSSLKAASSLTSLALLLIACSGDGFKTSDSGLKYKFHRMDEDGRKPVKGELLWVHMSAHLRTDKGDSLLFDSESMPDYEGGIKFIGVSEPEYKGDIMEGLAMMHLGDSASFIISADSFLLVSNRLDQLPPGIKPGMEMIFHIGVADIQSEKATMQKINDLQAKMAIERNADKQKRMDEEPQAIQEYMDKKGFKVEPTSTGLYYIETAKGKGPKPTVGQRVKVHYTGYLLNGRKFDSSFDREAPFEFNLGKGEVIGGWDEGIALMNVGTSATLIVPSQLGYGSSGSGIIPPFAPLVFEVQLIEILK
jgi:FKBP-type peptidyl-prolyl cis-trans isomerase